MEICNNIEVDMYRRMMVYVIIAGELLQSYKEGGHFQQEVPETLSPRQREVMQLLAEGHSTKEIADILCLSPRTVEFHQYKLMEDLEAKTVAALVKYTIKHGIVTI
jgi:DNA-binding NarL/FixJ family response regulator